jgi:hypothetical protein
VTSGGTIVVSGSDDGQSWAELGRATSPPQPARRPPATVSVEFSAPAHHRIHRVAPEGDQWSVAELAFFRNNQRVEIGGPFHFTSAWKPATLSSKEDSVVAPIQLEFPADLTPVHFIRLKLTRGERPRIVVEGFNIQ